MVVCEYCNKELGTYKRLRTHYETCLEYAVTSLKRKCEQEIQWLEERLKEKDEHIARLQDKLVNIALHAVSRPDTITTNVVNYVVE